MDRWNFFRFSNKKYSIFWYPKLATGIPKNRNSKNSGGNSDFLFHFLVNENMHQKLEDATKVLSIIVIVWKARTECPNACI